MAAARIRDPDAPVTVATFATEMEADLLSSELRRAGIDARTLGGTISGFKAEAPSDVTVVVPFARLDEAIALRDELARDAKIDWTQVNIGDMNTGDMDDTASSQSRSPSSKKGDGTGATLRSILLGILLAAGLLLAGTLVLGILSN